MDTKLNQTNDFDKSNTKTTEWFEKESNRLELLRMELRKGSSLLKEQREQLLAEKESFQKEMKQTLFQIEEKKQKLKEEEAFFDKKFKILEMGFANLEADKKQFEAQKRAFEYKQKFYQDVSDFSQGLEEDILDVASQTYFFRGVTHHLALKKRYKDLIKIYHPDNLDGDKSALQQINKEYEQMKKVLLVSKKA